MTDQASTELREEVRARYAEAARAVRDPKPGSSASCCGASTDSCGSTGSAALDTADVFGGSLYAEGQPVKTLIPTDEARQYVPAIFEKVIGGMSLRHLADWLDEQGVKPTGVKGKAGRWGETSLSQLIRNPVYSGRRKNAQGGTDLEVEPLVTIDTQEQAKATLAQQAKPGRSTVKRPQALLAKLVCGAPGWAAKRAAIQGVSEADLAALGPSPMSRIISVKGKGTSD